MTWKKYPLEHRQRAYVAATDLKAGKIKALGGTPVNTRVVEDATAKAVLIQVTRKKAAPGTPHVASG